MTRFPVKKRLFFSNDNQYKQTHINQRTFSEIRILVEINANTVFELN